MKPGRLQIEFQKLLQVMAYRDLAGLAAFVYEVQAILVADVIQILESQPGYSADSRGGIDKDAEDCLIAKAHNTVSVN